MRCFFAPTFIAASIGIHILQEKKIDDLKFKFSVADDHSLNQYDFWPGHHLYTHTTGNTGCYLADQLRFTRDHLIERGDVVFEVGAEWGFTTVLIGLWIGPQGRLLAFEPSSRFYDTTVRNVEINNLLNTTVIRKAIGSEAKEGVPFDGFQVDFSSEVSKVDQCTLDSYFDESPTLLKLDIEGYEVDALKGAQKILKTLPKLQIELHTELLARYNTSLDEFFGLIPVAQYDFFIQWDGDRGAIVPFNLEREKHQISKRVQLYALPK